MQQASRDEDKDHIASMPGDCRERRAGAVGQDQVANRHQDRQQGEPLEHHELPSRDQDQSEQAKESGAQSVNKDEACVGLHLEGEPQIASKACRIEDSAYRVRQL